MGLMRGLVVDWKDWKGRGGVCLGMGREVWSDE